MKKINILIVFLFIGICCLSSCTPAQHSLNSCLTGHEFGFWGGLWHGIIAPFSFFMSIFSDDYCIYAVNNNGGWYNFGYLLGTGSLSFIVGNSNRN